MIIDFDTLLKSDEPLPKLKIDIGEELGIKLKLSITEQRDEKERIRHIEPGYKVPILSVGSILGTWCNCCNDTTMQVLKHDGSKLICMNCKKIRKLKQQ